MDQPNCQLKKQMASIKLNAPSTIVQETSSQFDPEKKYFLVPSPEVKRSEAHFFPVTKFTSTVLDIDEDLESTVSLSQIAQNGSPSYANRIRAASFVENDPGFLYFDNPLCESILETREHEMHDSTAMVKRLLVASDVYVESYGFRSDQFQTANSKLFAQEEYEDVEIFV